MSIKYWLFAESFYFALVFLLGCVPAPVINYSLKRAVGSSGW